jgi:hypothetical protein
MSSPIQWPAYHVATVTDDLPRSQAQLSRTLEVSWGRTISHRIRFATASGIVVVDLALAYSIDGPPHLELIQRRPGSPYETTGLHHTGHWVDDVAEASAALEASGWPRECVPVDDADRWIGGAYHRSPDGLRIELVSAPASGPKLRRYLAGGPYA